MRDDLSAGDPLPDPLPAPGALPGGAVVSGQTSGALPGETGPERLSGFVPGGAGPEGPYGVAWGGAVVSGPLSGVVSGEIGPECLSGFVPGEAGPEGPYGVVRGGAVVSGPLSGVVPHETRSERLSGAVPGGTVVSGRTFGALPGEVGPERLSGVVAGGAGSVGDGALSGHPFGAVAGDAGSAGVGTPGQPFGVEPREVGSVGGDVPGQPGAVGPGAAVGCGVPAGQPLRALPRDAGSVFAVGCADALAGPLPGRPSGVVPGEVGAACAALVGGARAEVFVAFVRPPGTSAAVLDAVNGGPLLVLGPAEPLVPVGFVGDPGVAEPVLVVDRGQVGALRRLLGEVAPRHVGAPAVAEFVRAVSEAVGGRGARWPRAVAAVTGRPLTVLVPEHLVPSGGPRIVLLDNGLRPWPGALAAVLVLDYDVLRRSRLPAEVVAAARRWHEQVGERLVVAVDGVERRGAAPDGNLYYTVWRWVREQTGVDLAASAVVPVSSAWAMELAPSARPTLAELRRRGDEKAGVHVLTRALAPLWEDLPAVLTAALTRNPPPAGDEPVVGQPGEWRFDAAAETAAWSRLHRVACGPLAERLGEVAS
ncbi:hypothetical protein [Actinosynnema sp. NPDC020468]|uniref:hypothetical protein n=1 Tax=Actinosynnema sp. NPDC020468 TaxID=3154488 RepID=UPI0034010AA3